MPFFKTKRRIQGTTEHSWLSEYEGQEEWHNKPEKNLSLDAGRALIFLNSDFSKDFHTFSYPLSWKLWTMGRPQSGFKKWPDFWVQRTVVSGLKSKQSILGYIQNLTDRNLENLSYIWRQPCAEAEDWTTDLQNYSMILHNQIPLS